MVEKLEGLHSLLMGIQNVNYSQKELCADLLSYKYCSLARIDPAKRRPGNQAITAKIGFNFTLFAID